MICEFWIGSNPIDGKQCPHMRGVTVITFVASTLVRHLNQFERVLPSKPHTHKKKKQPPVDFESESILVLEKHQLAIHFQTPRQPLHRPASTASAMSVARARRDTLRNSANALHDLELVTSYDQLTSHALVIP